MAPDAAVDAVRAGECLGGEPFVVDHPRFLHDAVIDEPDVQTAVGHHEVVGVTRFIRSGRPSTTDVASTVSFISFSPAHSPENRLSA